MTDNNPKITKEVVTNTLLQENLLKPTQEVNNPNLGESMLPHTAIQTIAVKTSLDNVTEKIRPLHNTKISPEISRLIELKKAERAAFLKAQQENKAPQTSTRIGYSIVGHLKRFVNRLKALTSSMIDHVVSAIEKAFKFWIELKLLRLKKPSLFFKGVEIKDLRNLPPEVRSRLMTLRRKARKRARSLDHEDDKNESDEFDQELLELIETEEAKKEKELNLGSDNQEGTITFSMDKDGKPVFTVRKL